MGEGLLTILPLFPFSFCTHARSRFSNLRCDYPQGGVVLIYIDDTFNLEQLDY